jgi:2-polyprenyl-3-methyl-5-hydroxy-6-metoxy-1,4-benzoquinol methylase
LPADGELCIGVLAALLGWKVMAFDLSIERRSKAPEIAKENYVSIEYIDEDLEQLLFEPAWFDANGLVCVHFCNPKKIIANKKLNEYLKTGEIRADLRLQKNFC